MAGITEYGFVRKTLQEIMSSLQTRFRTKLGNNWNTTDGSIEQQFVGVFAEELDQAWQGIEGVYSSQTIDGAEGIYLDDVLSLTGVFRKGKQASSGDAVLLSDASVLSIGTVIQPTLSISAANSITYNPTDTTTLNNTMDCYRLSSSQLIIGESYSFNIYSLDNISSATFMWTIESEQDKDVMLTSLVEFANQTVINVEFASFYDPISRTAYIGFNPSTKLPLPILQKIYVNSTPKVGLYGHKLGVVANVKGFNPLGISGLLNISPIYNGYSSIVNYEPLFSGAEVQTDAEYRLAFNQTDRTSLSGTEDALLNGLLNNVEGVIAAAYYPNPTPDFVYDVSNNLVCQPYTFNTVVLGGTDEDVANEIFRNQSLNARTYGESVFTVFNTLNKPKDVFFTRATYFDIGVKVTYQAKNNAVLTEVESAALRNALIDYVDNLTIGEEILIEEVRSVCYANVPSSKRRGISVEIKDLGAAAGYIVDDLQPDYKEKPRLATTNIVINRTV